MTNDPRNLLTTRQAAEYAHMTQQAVFLAIQRGSLPATKLGRDWWIDRTHLDAYLDQRPDRFKQNKEQPQ
jgi:excisionase family DNA binding protein